MDPSSLSPLYLFPLVGGYFFSITWSITLYTTSRASGNRLYFISFFCGVILCVIAFFIHKFLFTSYPWYYDFIKLINTSFDRVSEISVLSKTSQEFILLSTLFLGPLLGKLLNAPLLLSEGILIDSVIRLTNEIKRITGKWYEVDPIIKSLIWLLEKIDEIGQWYVQIIMNNAIKNNDFEILLARAVYRDIPVMLTLDTGKLYVGWIVRIPNPAEFRKAVRILPMLSGYRNNETHDVEFTQNYYTILNDMSDGKLDTLAHLEIDDFEVVLPYDRIVSSHLFDPKAYVTFKDNGNDDDSDNAETSIT